MTLLSIDELKTLSQHQGLCVSLIMPTYKAGAETQQNPIRFKNLIKQAEAQLQDKYGLRQPDALTLLQPAMDLDTEDFWQHQDEGLALFLAEDFLRYYRLPLSFDELVVVSDRFHLKPLMPLLTGDGTFYLLALSQEQVRLFEGTHYTMREVELTDVTTNMARALQYDETAADGQFRISTPKGGTNNPFPQTGSFHGQGSPDRDDHKADISQFFNQLDRSLSPYLQDAHAPLVLAGVEYLIPIYREATSYHTVLDDAITENPDGLNSDELHAQAWAIVEPYFEQTKQAVVNHYQELTATGKTSTDLKEVVSAAYYGRVDQLFVAIGLQKWGNFDPQDNKLHLHADAEPEDEDLLNSAAIQTC